jgi:hypothetical protein
MIKRSIKGKILLPAIFTTVVFSAANLEAAGVFLRLTVT